MIFKSLDAETMLKNPEKISEMDRREFLKIGLVITGVFAGGSILSVASAADKIFPNGSIAEKYPYRPHYCMVIRVDRCIGCRRCVEGCAAANAVPSYGWRTLVLEKVVLQAVGQKREFIPVLCNQCNNPPCVRACPVTATYKDKKTGIVMMDNQKCIGCKICMAACPYEARYYNEERGAVDKCDFCFETSLSRGGKSTACQAACPADVRVFGDLSDPQSRVYRLVHQLQQPVWVLKKDTDAKPNIFYTKG
ncbi:MAG: 4Fe-4S dicluster domain-containing protein [Smithellaceae bacterium]|jgi:protein NrfC|nr:4Fe-4S dicluster domain-containing protein [Smithellaceae bacterium]MDD3259589.1 4Fe-4S dicluster domain-containing protein [Smithellaceae bacterium]MDD3848196.1 4Fe-4S dicluster domain-containing protein [Smithellaceae bacterium]